MRDVHETVIFGENVSIECEKLKIGKYSKIGNNVKIKCKELEIGDHFYMCDDVEIGRGGCTNPNSIVKIGNDVWLPARSIVLPNVTIGDNVVVGIDSIVNKSLPDGCLAAGSPCKIIKENMYPKKLSDEQITEMTESIISDWLELIKAKGVTRTIEISYNNNEIVLNQGYEQTIYNIIDKTIDGDVNNVSEDLRDYLRRRGIKIYADRFFKSI